jgi:hypothetical protein
MSFKFYERAVPDDIFEKMDDLYQSPYCVRDYHRIYHPSDEINALVISRYDSPVQILLFMVKDRCVEILNRLYSIDCKFIDFASDAIFNKYANVVRVNYEGIYATSLSSIRSPHLILDASEDIILELPENSELYYNKLSKNTRKYIRHYHNRLNKAFGNVKFEIKNGENINIKTIRQIIAFNRLRMANKGKKSDIDEDYEKKICRFSKLYGYVGAIEINNNVRAGTIFYKVGGHVYLHVISHDGNFDKYALGILCLFDTIKYCIQIGIQEFHMLWGTYEYKYRFLGLDKEVYSIAVFRSNLNKMLAYHEMFASVIRTFAIKYGSLLLTKFGSNKKLAIPVLQIKKLYFRLMQK